MKISRKKFLKAGTILTGGLFLQGSNLLSAFQNQPAGFSKITENIGFFTERGGTIGWYAANDGVVIIDSQYPETAKNLIAGIKQKSDRKIDLLFNTHHHGDHTSGNVYLKEYVNKIVAQENCKALQEKSYGGDPAKPQVYADATFKNTWSENIGKEKVTAIYFGSAHTGGDSVIHFEDANIAHVGDLVFNRTFPFIDPNGGGTIKDWHNTLGKIIKYFSKDTRFIFGHSITPETITGTKQDVEYMRDYFEALIEFVSDEIKKGKSKEEVAMALVIPGFENLKERREGMRKMSLENAYIQLSK